MSVVLISGSPGSPSRTTAIVEHIAQELERQGIETEVFNIADFSANELVFGDITAPQVAYYRRIIDEAEAVVLATPVYQASFSGAIKLLLDLIPERGLKGKVVLPLASGGSDSHLLILDYALKPVLSALGASNVLSGVYVNSKYLSLGENKRYRLEGDALGRIDRSVDELVELIDTVDRSSQPSEGVSGHRVAYA